MFRSCAYIFSLLMLVKVESIDTIENKVKVTQLDIDDHGSVIPLKELEFNIPNDDSIIQTLKNSSYSAIFTEDSIEVNNNIIILANGMTTEKNETIDKASK